MRKRFQFLRFKNRRRKAICSTICLAAVAVIICFGFFAEQPAVDALSKYGSSGVEVTAIQQKLTDYGLYSGPITGYYGSLTQDAVTRFQRARGLLIDGIAGPQTLKALGISIGAMPTANESNVYLLARITSAEARGETYLGQVAVAAVILNRVKHPSFPDTLAGVIYQPGAFTAVSDGQFNEPIADSAYSAAREALGGNDPSGGAIYYYNPDKTSNAWIRTRPVIKRIGQHLFCS